MSIPFVSAFAVLAVVAVYPCLRLSSRLKPTWLIGLSLAAVLVGLIGTPVGRFVVRSEAAMFWVLIGSLLAAYSLTSVAIVASVIGLIRLRRRRFVATLLIALLALGLFNASIMTDWIWPYARFGS